MTCNPFASQSNSQHNRKSNKMSSHHLVHIPTYEGEKYPRRHWFIFERMWDVADVIDDDNKIAQFADAL